MSSSRRPFVSVVIPTHNRGYIIGASITSVLSQTYSDIEVIVIDDASSDNTEEVVEKLNDRRVKYYKTPKTLGPSGARNTGIERSAGAFVFFQDSDDIWFPKKIERQLNHYYTLADRKNNVVGGFCRFVKVRGNLITKIPKEQKITSFDGDFHEALLDGNFIGTPTLMVQTNVLRNLGGFDETLSSLEDWDLALRLTRHGLLSFTNEILVCSLTSEDSVNSKPCGDSILKLIENNKSSFLKHRIKHAARRTEAAGEFIKHGDRDNAITAARESLNVMWTAKGMAIAMAPKFYEVLMALKEFVKSRAEPHS